MSVLKLEKNISYEIESDCRLSTLLVLDANDYVVKVFDLESKIVSMFTKSHFLDTHRIIRRKKNSESGADYDLYMKSISKLRFVPNIRQNIRSKV